VGPKDQLIKSYPLTEENLEEEEIITTKMKNQLKLTEGLDQQNHSVDSKWSENLNFSQGKKDEIVSSKSDQSDSLKELMNNLIRQPNPQRNVQNNQPQPQTIKTEMASSTSTAMMEEKINEDQFLSQLGTLKSGPVFYQDSRSQDCISKLEQRLSKGLMNNNDNTNEGFYSNSQNTSDLDHGTLSEEKKNSSNTSN
jgi:hypothetical protein